MPATAGRVRMPANNRVHSSAALQTHGIWQSAIGYDPYAPATAKESGSGARPGSDSSAYASFQGLLALAKITGSNSNETRGACRKCGRVGHLTYQCRNFLVLKEEEKKDVDGDRTALRTADAIMEKIKKSNGTGVREESSEEEEVESSSSDSDVDPEIERIIKKRYGWTLSKKVSLEDEEEERRVRGRRRQKRKDRRRDRDSESSDESSSEESDRSDRHRRKRRRKREEDSLSASDSSHGDRKGRKKREKRSHIRRRHCKD